MAQFRKDEHLLTDDGNGVVLAHLGAAPAVGTGLGIYLGDRLRYLAVLLDGGVEEESSVGLLYITVKKQRMAGGQRRTCHPLIRR